MSTQIIEFYDLKTRTSVEISSSKVTKKVIERPTKSGGVSLRYQLIGTLPDDRKVFKFVSKDTYESIA